MIKTEIDFVTELVQKTLNISSTEAASLLFDVKEDGSGELKGTALPTLLDKDKARVQAFKEEATQAHDKGFKKAQAEALTKFEKDLKEKYGITSDKQGVELIEQVVTEKIKASGTGEADEEKIKRSKLYLDTVDRLTKEKTDAVSAEAKKFTDLQTSIQKESTFKSVSETVLDYIKNDLMPILPEGKTADGKSKADIQLQKFVKDFASEYDIEVKDGRILLSKDGKLLEDPHGKHYDIKDVVKAKASEVWDFKEGQARQGTGNKHEAGGAAGSTDKGYKGPIPKNEVEYLDMVKKAPDDKTKQELTKVWVANQPKS
jgi:hypothetical protein